MLFIHIKWEIWQIIYLNYSFQKACISWQGFSHWILKRSLGLKCYKNTSKDWKDAVNSFISKHCLINTKLLLKDLIRQVLPLDGRFNSWRENPSEVLC